MAGRRGVELAREGGPKSFPDAVILHQTTPGAALVVADHDPGAAARAIVSVTSRWHDRDGAGDIADGFSLRPGVRHR
ncbi:MAG TPA: hypothetical protein VGM96_13285 [Reyranella sp.]|jgi:hypothetical protein